MQLFSCLDKISYIEWAQDSEYILCGLYRRPMIQAWSLTQPEWTCKIDEGPAGIAYARWSPDSRHILTLSDFQVRLTVWSLVNTACVHVQWPKHATRGLSFTRDGKFAAICTRHDCKDYINLVSCHNWEIMGNFAVDTLDLADIEWSPDDSAIVIWDAPLEYKVITALSVWLVFSWIRKFSTWAVRSSCIWVQRVAAGISVELPITLPSLLSNVTPEILSN